MTKIKRAPKRTPSTHPGIASFIKALAVCADDELPGLLQPVCSSGWTWPRTDLQHWIVPLNRFDAILEGVVNDYDLSSMEHCQTNAFTPRTKQLVAAILAFEKVLLENSTNRKIFASFDVSDYAASMAPEPVYELLELTTRFPVTSSSSSAASQRPPPHDRPVHPSRYPSPRSPTSPAVLEHQRRHLVVWNRREASPQPRARVGHARVWPRDGRLGGRRD